jgi:hypothetical protein
MKIRGNRREIQLIAKLMVDFQGGGIKTPQILRLRSVRNVQRVVRRRIRPVVKIGAASGAIPVVIEVESSGGRVVPVQESESPASFSSAIDRPVQNGVKEIAVRMRVEKARARIEAGNQRTGNEGGIGLRAVVAELDARSRVKIIGRQLGDVFDRTTDVAAAIQRTLRSFEYLDPLDIVRANALTVE